MLAVVDRARHDVGEEEDGVCRSGPRTFTAAAAEEEGDVEVIVLLLRARHDDDKRAERVAVHAAQDAILLQLTGARTNR